MGRRKEGSKHYQREKSNLLKHYIGVGDIPSCFPARICRRRSGLTRKLYNQFKIVPAKTPTKMLGDNKYRRASTWESDVLKIFELFEYFGQ